MKKLLLIVFSVIFSLVAVAANLNPFAYDLNAVYNKADHSVTISYSLNAVAKEVRVVIYQDEANPVVTKSFTANQYLTPGVHTDAKVELAGKPGGNYFYKVEVYGAGQTSTTAFHKRMILNSPTSIDIDNNTNSPYFGRTLVTQPTTKNNTLRGIYEFKPVDFTTNTSQVYGGDGISHNGGTEKYYQGDQSWFYRSHATPLCVRIAQDGTGRIFTTAFDVAMDTYLWYVNPANLDEWTSLITASEMNTIAGYPGNKKLHNMSLDVRVESDKRITLLLLSGEGVTGENSNFKVGYVYSGTYTLPANFPTSTAGTYTSIAEPILKNGSIQSPHNYIKSGALPTAITSSSQFDMYGGYWYCGYTQATDPDGDGVALQKKSGLQHITINGDIKDDYHKSDDKLRRYWTTSGGFRYNPELNQVLVADGVDKTARLYKVSQASETAHPTLTFVADLGTIFSSAANYITDFAWDHANNIYVVLRNGDSGYGIYTFATKYDAATPFVTKARNTFEAECYDNVSYTLTTGVSSESEGSVSAGGTYVSCSNATITATPKEGYRFDHWVVNGTQISDNSNPLTITMTDDMNVVAHFGPNLLAVKYYHLLADNNNVLGWDMANDNLWALFKAYFNDYNLKYHSVTGNNIRANGMTIKEVLTFIDGTYGVNYIADVMTNTRSDMKWLGDYIKSVAAEEGKTVSTAKEWRGYVCSFFKCQSKPTNSADYHDSSYGTTADFTQKGSPIYWHHYYTEHLGKLPPTIGYKNPLPVEIKEVVSFGSTHTYASYPTWYNSNVDGKLLGWYYEGDATKTIISDIKAGGNLYASWIDKTIDETKDNTDVVKLLKNTNHGNTSTPNHNITVKRSFLSDVNAYNTICLPFSLTTAQLAASPYAGATILKFINTEILDDGEGDMLVLNFEQVTSIEAGVPYLIQPKSDLGTSKTFTGVPYSQCSEVAHSVECEHATFHAVLNNGEVKVDAYSPTLVLVDQNRLALVSSNGTMKGLRGYFTINPSVASLALDGKCYLSMRKPTTTTVEEITAPQPTAKEPKAQKIMRDGKIYILHGDHIYTITGQKIR